MLNPLKKATRKSKTNTVAAGSVAHGFNGLRLELELDRAVEGTGYIELATVLCQLICYQFCYLPAQLQHLHVCCSSISIMSYGNLSVLYDKFHIHTHKYKYVCAYIFVQCAVLADLSIVYRIFCFEWPTK